jgi:hypothetical protein
MPAGLRPDGRPVQSQVCIVAGLYLVGGWWLGRIGGDAYRNQLQRVAEHVTQRFDDVAWFGIDHAGWVDARGLFRAHDLEREQVWVRLPYSPIQSNLAQSGFSTKKDEVERLLKEQGHRLVIGLHRLDVVPLSPQKFDATHLERLVVAYDEDAFRHDKPASGAYMSHATG